MTANLVFDFPLGWQAGLPLAAGALGSIDANTGDLLLGWDTDQFPTNIYLTTEIMLSILKMGGFKTGGTNFDAKVRRESFEPVDLFHAHIGGMDAFARGLKTAAAIRKDGRLAKFVHDVERDGDVFQRGRGGVVVEFERGLETLPREHEILFDAQPHAGADPIALRPGGRSRAIDSSIIELGCSRSTLVGSSTPTGSSPYIKRSTCTPSLR